MINIEMSRGQLKALHDFIISAKISQMGEPGTTPYDKWNDLGQDIENALYAIESALERPIYLNAYAITRHYGGPEEGGWWYNAGQLIETIETTADKADDERSKLEEKHKEIKEGNIYSVLGGVDLEVHIDDEPGRDFPEARPRYE